jgi:hypothetical protein
VTTEISQILTDAVPSASWRAAGFVPPSELPAWLPNVATELLPARRDGTFFFLNPARKVFFFRSVFFLKTVLLETRWFTPRPNFIFPRFLVPSLEILPAFFKI